MEKGSEIRVDTSEKISHCGETLELLAKTTRHRIWLLHNNDVKIAKMKEFNRAMIDPYQNIRDFISYKISFPICFLSYNWNTILCNLPLAYLPKI